MKFLQKNRIAHLRGFIVMLGFALIPVSSAQSRDSMIAFSSDRDNFGGNRDIFVMMADGSKPRNLTNNRTSSDSNPSWSPDGTKIAFESHHDDSSDVYVIHADGKNLIQLTRTPESDGQPSWSPDGRKIAFTSRRDGNFFGPFFVPDYEVFVMDADGDNVVRRTRSAESDIAPSWSPDGTNIAFESQRDLDYEIYIMGADGRNVVRLTRTHGIDSDPSWSPDGTKIAFRSETEMPKSTSWTLMAGTSSGLPDLPGGTAILVGLLMVGKLPLHQVEMGTRRFMSWMLTAEIRLTSRKTQRLTASLRGRRRYWRFLQRHGY